MLGAGLHPDAVAVAPRGRRASAARGSSTRRRDPGVQVGRSGTLPAAQLRARARRRRGVSRPPRPGRRSRRRRPRSACPGASRSSACDPLTLLDGAHNPDGMRALAESLPEIRRPAATGSSRSSRSSTTRTRRGCWRRCSRLATRSSSPAVKIRGPCRRPRSSRSRASSAAAVARSCATRARRSRRARELAGPGGVVLATGSIYLVADLLRPARERRARLDGCERRDDQPELPHDDRPRGADRRGGDPRLLRDRLPVRPGVSVTKRQRVSAMDEPNSTRTEGRHDHLDHYTRLVNAL